MISALLACTLAATPAQPPASGAAPPADGRAAEAPFLTRHVQLTFPDRFARAGEQYFDHQTPPRWVVFQAVERPAPGREPDAHYAMYVAALRRDDAGHVVGLDEPIRVSPPGSANTCGWFHRAWPGTVIFGSTLVPPAAADSPGYSRDRQRYSWQFPKEMDVVIFSVPQIDIETLRSTPYDALSPFLKARYYGGARGDLATRLHLADTPDTKATADALAAKVARGESVLPPVTPVFQRPGYDAECSFSPDGRFILYTHVDPANNDPNLWVFDSRTGRHTPIVTARGYDGGPFFSPDGKWIAYRSDRAGNNVLQLFLGELAFGDDDDPAVPIGLAREIQLTAPAPGQPEREQAVNWCPFFHPSGDYLVYATSEIGHHNYEVFAIDIAPVRAGRTADRLRTARVTHAPGFDGLPAFSADGRLMMWTSQRGPKRDGEERPSSQMWIAEVVGEPAWTPVLHDR